MIVISDTNVLSSFAAAEALSLLQQLFAQVQIAVPPSVGQELQAGLERGKAHLDVVLQAIASGQILVLALSLEEVQQLAGFPARLNLGEREAIALTVTRRATLLSNDRRAINYCRQQQVRVVSLVDLLRLLWVRQVVRQDEVRALIAKMRQVENLVLTPEQEQVVFAPRRQR